MKFYRRIRDRLSFKALSNTALLRNFRTSLDTGKIAGAPFNDAAITGVCNLQPISGDFLFVSKPQRTLMDKIGVMASVLGHAIKSGIQTDGNNLRVGKLRRRRRAARAAEASSSKMAPV